MAQQDSNKLLLYINSAAIGLLTNVTLNWNQDTRDITVKSDNGTQKVIGTKRSRTVTADFLRDTTDTAQLSALDAISAGTEVKVKFYHSTVLQHSANAVIESISLTAGTDDVTTGTITLRLDGAWA